MIWLSSIITLLSLSILGTSAFAGGPSFDCTQARTGVEKLICGDAGLAALDFELARIYGQRRKSLVGDGAEEALVAEQREWRKKRDLACPVPRGAEGEALNTAAACLAEAYRFRLAELDPEGATGAYAVRVVAGKGVCIGPDGRAVPMARRHAAGGKDEEYCAPEAPAWAKGWGEVITLFCGRDPDYGAFCDELAKLDARLVQVVAEKTRSLGGVEAMKLAREQQDWLARRLEKIPDYAWPPSIAEYLGNSDRYDGAFMKWTGGDLIDLYKDRIAKLTNKPIELLYSAEDRLCEPLVQALNRYRGKHPRAYSFLRAYGDLAVEVGLSEPVWFDEEGKRARLPYPDMARPVLFRADVTGDGEERTVYAQYNHLGMYGTYETWIWILKPGAEFRKKTGPWDVTPKGATTPKYRQETDVDPDIVDLRIAFDAPPAGWPFAYRDVTRENGRLRFAAVPRPSTEAEEAVFQELPFGQIAQDPFLFEGRTYFGAGDLFTGRGVVYRVLPDMIAEIVCVTRVDD